MCIVANNVHKIASVYITLLCTEVLFMHSHSFSGYTSYNNGHRHYYMGMTSISPDVPGHIHYMAGYTSFDDGHTHAYRSATGPAIYIGSMHYHGYRGTTGIADRHTHNYDGRTSSYYGMH
ncbi:YmaF family protein [Clostridium thermosuccinogenes]|uniref:YmaF family protein n=1 Tax=Clostridium thermosuccinogenes TaxID=84032 RepID=UPI000CCC299C|nr:hypothetical protein CDQ83_01455 [Pseudoclostridium thermosuccinogenes]